MTIFLIVLAIMLLLVGVAGTIFPVIPALPLMLGIWFCDGFCGGIVGRKIHGGE